ncbi:MAG TPA: hypothetical protein VGM76_08940 [Lacipirellulaceae bacterium]
MIANNNRILNLSRTAGVDLERAGAIPPDIQIEFVRPTQTIRAKACGQTEWKNGGIVVIQRTGIGDADETGPMTFCRRWWDEPDGCIACSHATNNQGFVTELSVAGDQQLAEMTGSDENVGLQPIRAVLVCNTFKENLISRGRKQTRVNKIAERGQASRR